MKRCLLALLFAATATGQVSAAVGELTCAQYLKAQGDTPPEDQNEVRMRAYCKAHPKVPAGDAHEKTFKL